MIEEIFWYTCIRVQIIFPSTRRKFKLIRNYQKCFSCWSWYPSPTFYSKRFLNELWFIQTIFSKFSFANENGNGMNTMFLSVISSIAIQLCPLHYWKMYSFYVFICRNDVHVHCTYIVSQVSIVSHIITFDIAQFFNRLSETNWNLCRIQSESMRYCWVDLYWCLVFELS